MAIEVSGLDELMLMISQGGDRAVRGVAAEMRRQADATRDIARQMVPLDEGNLEHAIDVEEDRSGINGRATFYVFVDESLPVPERPGHIVGDYAMRMHEDWGYQLGLKSQQKQVGNPYRVGPGYITRAGQEIEKTLVADLTAAAKRSLS